MSLDLQPMAVAERYWQGLVERYRGVRALMLRNPLADFVPGISDLDLRLVVDRHESDDWGPLADAIAEVHSEQLASGPGTWRLLEHPPGACVTVEEALDPRLFHPEMRQWEPAFGDQTVVERVMENIAVTPWSSRDERYWHRRFQTYLAPWVEPEERINLQVGQRQRYHLHYLVMLLALPALQAAYCLIHRRPVSGKVAGLQAWREMLPGDTLLAELDGLVAAGLESAALKDPIRLADLRDRCRRRIDLLAGQLPQREADPALPADPLLDLFDAVRYSRLRPAHYRCFLKAPPGFQTDFFQVNEVHTLHRAILEPAQKALRVLVSVDDPAEPLACFCRTQDESDALGRAVDAAYTDTDPEEARVSLSGLVDLYHHFHRLLERGFSRALGSHGLAGSTPRAGAPGGLG